MAYNYTKGSDLDKLARRVEADVKEGFNYGVDEIALLNKFATEDTPFSYNDDGVIFPIDLNEGFGAASIEEFGHEPNPSTPDLEEATEGVVHVVGRFNLSNKVKHTDKGTANWRERVLGRAAMKKAQALRIWWGDAFYGDTSAVLAITDSDLSSATPTLTLKDGYGRTDIDDPGFLARKFPVGSTVALVAAGSDALIDANAYGTVTARSLTAGTITLALAGSVTYSTNGIRIVRAEVAAGGQDVTITGTDLGKGVAGLLQINTAAALHGLTHENWTAALTDTTGGRFNAQRYRKMKNAVENDGRGTMRLLVMDQGVYNDTVALQSSGLRFSEPGALSLDGDLSARGLTIFQGKRCLPGYVFGCDPTGTSRWMQVGIPEENTSKAWSEGKEYIDRNGKVFRLDMMGQMVTHNRKKWAMLSGLDRV